MKFSTIITIIASVAVGSANASPSFLRSTVKMSDEEKLVCYQACATDVGREGLDIKKNKAKGNVKGDKIVTSAETCAAEHCGGATRSIEEKTCTDTCYVRFGKDAAKAINKAIDKAIDEEVKKCERKCDSCKKDDPDYDDCKKKLDKCEKDCKRTRLSISAKKVQKEVTKKVQKPVSNVDDCLSVCILPAADEEEFFGDSEDYDYETPSFLRSSVNESTADCYKQCLNPDSDKRKNLKAKKIAASVEDCYAEYCDATSRSIEENACAADCAKDFGKGVEKAVEKAIDSCEDKCEKSCSSSDEDESGSKDDCKRDCEKECDSGSLDSSTVKKAEKNINKSFANGDACIDSCFPTATDYETLKIA